jgi:Tol biopolymer transport system component
VNGGEPRKLTSLQPGEIPMWPSWSPDGTRIAFFSRRTGVNYAYETEVSTGATRPLKSGEDYALFPQYSADGKSLFYVSNAGHRFRIWRQPLAPNSDAEPLAATEVRVFRISKDRRFLYFLQSGDAQRLIQLNLATKEEKPLCTFADSLVAFDAWDVAASELFYAGIEPERSVPQLFAVDLDSGQRRAIGSLRMVSHERQTGLAASPDGQSVVVAQVDTDDARLMLLRLGQ